MHDLQLMGSVDRILPNYLSLFGNYFCFSPFSRWKDNYVIFLFLFLFFFVLRAVNICLYLEEKIIMSLGMFGSLVEISKKFGEE